MELEDNIEKMKKKDIQRAAIIVRDWRHPVYSFRRQILEDAFVEYLQSYPGFDESQFRKECNGPRKQYKRD